jgi:DNA polymerase-3 subunit beta
VGDGPWRIVLTDTQASFERGTTAFSMRLLEGDFPDYKQVIPGGWQRRILVQREHVMQALRRVSILAGEKLHPVRFHIKDGTVIVTAKQPEAGEAREELESQVEGQDLEIGFNARYFLDSLGVMDTDTIAIEIGDSLSPCLVRPGDGDADELFVVMPMRLE